jgi:hypothetical protein
LIINNEMLSFCAFDLEYSMNVRALNEEIMNTQADGIDLTADMWKLILSKELWGVEALRWIDREFKNYMLGQIGKIENPTVRQNAMWQALIKESFLGNIFYTQLEGTPPGIMSGSLKAVATQLNKTKLPFNIEEDTLKKLLRDNSLMRDIKENYPILYSNLREHSLHICPNEFRSVLEGRGSMAWLLQRLAGVNFDFCAGIQVVIPNEPIKRRSSLLELADPVQLVSHSPRGFDLSCQSVATHVVEHDGEINSTDDSVKQRKSRGA